jgi:hypothetical protein
MEPLGPAFEERLAEINSYLDFLDGIEAAARSGPPRIGEAGSPITTQQQKILYSSVFLQLYNLVEATVVRCLDAVTGAALLDGTWNPGDLTTELRREWVRVTARTHVDLNYEHRLESALVLCEHLVQSLPVAGFNVDKGGGGNWDDGTIEAVAVRLGCRLVVERDTRRAVKRPFMDDLGALGLVKKRRNSLAHGSISFVECGENLTASDLRNLSDRIAQYLREVVAAFQAYITGYEYLIPARRPTPV